MVVLDIDLDLFLSGIPKRRGAGRLEDPSIIPWAPDEVRAFLRNQCRLQAEDPVKGRFFERHDEVFWYWKSLIDIGALDTPFEVVHLDSHADLGMGWMDLSSHYVMGDLLHKPVGERSNPKCGPREGMTEGSWLLFALACRWINKLVYVHNPKLNRELGDIAPCLMKDHDLRGDRIQLKKYSQKDLDGVQRLEKIEPLATEPEIPIEIVSASDFMAKSYPSLICVARSPNYTPASSDLLLPVLKRYISDRTEERETQ